MTKEYRVTVTKRHGSGQNDKARIQMSLGNPRYEGEKFFALCEWCNKRYGEVELILSDTLQRHNQTESMRYWQSYRRQGNEWLLRNREALRGMRIIRWDDLLHHPDYADTHEQVSNMLLDIKPPYLRETAMRQSQRQGVSYRQCVNFLTEELAAFALLFEDPADDIYAGSWITPLLDALPINAFSTYRCLSVDFERKKAA